jgi:hypothetical protein
MNPGSPTREPGRPACGRGEEDGSRGRERPPRIAGFCAVRAVAMAEPTHPGQLTSPPVSQARLTPPRIARMRNIRLTAAAPRLAALLVVAACSSSDMPPTSPELAASGQPLSVSPTTLHITWPLARPTFVATVQYATVFTATSSTRAAPPLARRRRCRWALRATPRPRPSP